MSSTARFTLLFLCLFPVALSPVARAADEILFADPTVYTENGRYYLTGTRGANPPGFAILESDNLRTWHAPAAPAPGFILQAGADVFGTSRFWAPQILKDGADYYLAYSADEYIALAKSRSLTGPFRQDAVGPINPAERGIDAFLFRDDDGRCYVYYVRFANGNFIWGAEFDLAAGRIKTATLTRCFGRTQAWEATASYQSPPIMEGPSVLKLRGRYYLFYSANHFRSVDYAVGYAVADSPLGPWVKYDGNPILHRSIVGENGSGHGDVFRGQDERLYYVYHVHASDRAVSPRRTRIVPLVLRWNEAQGRYDISVDAVHVIKPVVDAGVAAGTERGSRSAP